MTQPPYPVYADPLDKFRATETCAPGSPIYDTAIRTSDSAVCCSSCRSSITLSDGKWVHPA